MKRLLYILLAAMSLFSVLAFTACIEEETKTTDDQIQIFERFISGDDIPLYIPFGYEGLVSQYEYTKHYYRVGEISPYMTDKFSAYYYDSEAAAEKRFTSLKRTYKDEVSLVGNVIYIHQHGFIWPAHDHAAVRVDITEDFLKNGYILVVET